VGLLRGSRSRFEGGGEPGEPHKALGAWGARGARESKGR
jgi:hypothetical protein